jgi:hypothetical protein
MKKNNSQSTKAMPKNVKNGQCNDTDRRSFTSAERVLVALFGFGFILGFLLTPGSRTSYA